MDPNRQFFNRLNENIRNARSIKTLKILDKQGKKYLYNLPLETNIKTKRDVNKMLKNSQKLIKQRYKILKK